MIKLFCRRNHNLFQFNQHYIQTNDEIRNFVESLNLDEINHNNQIRNHEFQFDHFSKLIAKYKSGDYNHANEIIKMYKSLPNTVSKSTPIGNEKDSKILKIFNQNESRVGINIEKCGELLSQLRVENVFHGAESRAYYFNGDFARLERALIRYAIKGLIQRGFRLISVPDVISSEAVEKAGFVVDPTKNQIYGVACTPSEVARLLEPAPKTGLDNGLCLAGTSEMALATHLQDSVIDSADLPIKLCAVSRCYRREVSAAESHLFRVHQFYKVEMFVAVAAGGSNEMLEYIVGVQEALFGALGLGFRVVNIASGDLGAPAHQKVDLEAWLPGEARYGEISSASNCTDYQARRFNIVERDPRGRLQFVHTLNGTACALPRLLKAVVETNQGGEGEGGSVSVPGPLRPLIGWRERARRMHPPHKVRWLSDYRLM